MPLIVSLLHLHLSFQLKEIKGNLPLFSCIFVRARVNCQDLGGEGDDTFQIQEGTAEKNGQMKDLGMQGNTALFT